MEWNQSSIKRRKSQRLIKAATKAAINAAIKEGLFEKLSKLQFRIMDMDEMRAKHIKSQDLETIQMEHNERIGAHQTTNILRNKFDSIDVPSFTELPKSTSDRNVYEEEDDEKMSQLMDELTNVVDQEQGITIIEKIDQRIVMKVWIGHSSKPVKKEKNR